MFVHYKNRVRQFSIMNLVRFFVFNSLYTETVVHDGNYFNMISMNYDSVF